MDITEKIIITEEPPKKEPPKKEPPKKEPPKKEPPKKDTPKKDTPKKDDEKPYLTVKLPFTKTAESDAFRAWLRKNYPDYGDKTKMGSLSVDNAPSKYKTSNALKNAYNDKGAEYVKWLSGGGKVDPTTFTVTDGTYVPSNSTTTTTPTDVSKIKRKGCRSVANTSRFKGLSVSDEQRNDFMRSFLSWWKRTFNKTYFVRNGECGMLPKGSFDLWIYNELYDENGATYFAWEDENLNKLANIEETVDGESTTYFDMWLQDREQMLSNRANSQTTKKASTQTEKKNFSSLKLAADQVRISSDLNLRNNCKKIKDFLTGYNNSVPEINTEIEKCKTNFPLLMRESLENKITGKLKLMKENKQLNEKVFEKLKTKKLSKISENFYKQNYKKFFDTYSQYMKSNTMISEATNDEFSKSFDSIFKGKEEEFKKRAIEYIISKLEINPSSPLASEIKKELSKNQAKDLFTNEYDIPEGITKAIETTNAQSAGDETGLKGIVSKSIKIDDKQVKQGVRQHLQDYVNGVKADIKSLEEKLKSSIIKEV